MRIAFLCILMAAGTLACSPQHNGDVEAIDAVNESLPDQNTVDLDGPVSSLVDDYGLEEQGMWHSFWSSVCRGSSCNTFCRGWGHNSGSDRGCHYLNGRAKTRCQCFDYL